MEENNDGLCMLTVCVDVLALEARGATTCGCGNEDVSDVWCGCRCGCGGSGRGGILDVDTWGDSNNYTYNPD